MTNPLLGALWHSIPARACRLVCHSPALWLPGLPCSPSGGNPIFRSVCLNAIDIPFALGGAEPSALIHSTTRHSLPDSTPPAPHQRPAITSSVTQCDPMPLGLARGPSCSTVRPPPEGTTHLAWPAEPGSPPRCCLLRSMRVPF